MFLIDDRAGTEKIINLDNLVNIEIEESSPVNFRVVCRMTDGRSLAVASASTRDECVEIARAIGSLLYSNVKAFRISEVD